MPESGRWTAVTLVTLVLHFAWEMAQGNLFVSMQLMPFWKATAICARATVGDLVITAIAFSAAAIAGGLHWPLIRRRLSPGLIFLIVGILITIGYEIYAVSTGRWAYGERMPVIFGIGVTPLVQWVVIPLMEIGVFRLIWRGAAIDAQERGSQERHSVERSQR